MPMVSISLAHGLGRAEYQAVLQGVAGISHLSGKRFLLLGSVELFSRPADVLAAPVIRVNADPLRLGIGVGHDDIAPDPAVAHAALYGLIVEPALGHRRAILVEEVPGNVVGMYDQHDGTSLLGHLDGRSLGGHGPDDRRMRVLVHPGSQHRNFDVPELPLVR